MPTKPRNETTAPDEAAAAPESEPEVGYPERPLAEALDPTASERHHGYRVDEDGQPVEAAPAVVDDANAE